MQPSQRLAINTAATYLRSVLAMGLTLFSSRWVLNSLGHTDYGLFSLVGSVIILVTFLNGVMAGTVSRHLAYAIGKGEPGEVTQWFNTAFSIHLCMAFALVVIGWPIGDYVITHVFNIPVDRVIICIWVFRISLVSAFTNMVSVPFVAMFTAKQKIAEYAFWGMLQVLLTFVFAYLLTRLSGDLLLVYAIGMVIIIVFIQTMIICRAFVAFKECSIERNAWFEKSRCKKIFSFAIWNLFGNAGTTFRDQGSAILLNLYFGPSVNAAFGIAKQVSIQTNTLSSAMLGAFLPEVTSSEGRGNRLRMLSLSHRASKLGTILVMLFSIPLIVEMEYVFKLWLVEPPPHAVDFSRLILCTFMISRLSAGYMMAVNAGGKIAGCQAAVGFSLLLTLPLAWGFIYTGLAPTSVGIAFIISMALCTFCRVFWLHLLFEEPVIRWLKTVVQPCLLVGISSVVAAFVPHWLMEQSLPRLVLVTGLSIGANLLATWVLAFGPAERSFFRNNGRNLIQKFSNNCRRV